MGAFETADNDGQLLATTRLSGWVWHPEFTIADVVLLFGDIGVPVQFGLERPDVATRFSSQPQARFCGFITRENFPRGRGPIRLQVTTQCGRTYFLDAKLDAHLETGAYLPPRAPQEMWELSTLPKRPAPFLNSVPCSRGPLNILFMLYGDFTSNSANHVAAFSNQLIARGFDCIVAVPEHMETIGAQARARFLAIEFKDLANLPSYYIAMVRDRHSSTRGPRVNWFENSARG
ncbi:MAG: hypothetical protein J6386_02930 [Candidatus Synoicihabitans palmerolidicus]|nr:hypothetical protein [Candidatus Synoicihabitans palmerolidicus]